MKEQEKTTGSVEREDSAERADPVTVLIFDIDDDAKGPPHASPGHVVLARGETVVWENLTGDEIHLRLPPVPIFDPPTKMLTVPPDGRSDVLTVAADAPRGGRRYIGVRQSARGGLQLLVGGSTPVMIIR